MTEVKTLETLETLVLTFGSSHGPLLITSTVTHEQLGAHSSGGRGCQGRLLGWPKSACNLMWRGTATLELVRLHHVTVPNLQR